MSGIESGDADTQEKDAREIPIRDFSDIRRLRNSYLRRDDKPIGVDSNNNPIPDEHEEDFDLKHSTADEALQFYHDNVNEAEADDSLLEFLDDE